MGTQRCLDFSLHALSYISIKLKRLSCSVLITTRLSNIMNTPHKNGNCQLKCFKCLLKNLKFVESLLKIKILIEKSSSLY